MGRINVSTEELCTEYLKENATTKSVADIFGIGQITVSRKLRESGNETVLKKLRTNKKKTELKLSTVRVEDKTIYVTPNNSNNEHVFDYSEELHETLMKYTWVESSDTHLKTVLKENGKNDNIYAYWLVIGKPDNGVVVDHEDRDRRNNRKSNLRYASYSDNRINAKIGKNNTSGFTGVSFIKKRGKFRASIKKNYKLIEIGYFDTAEEAYVARAKKEIELFGKYANIHPDFTYLFDEKGE